MYAVRSAGDPRAFADATAGRAQPLETMGDVPVHVTQYEIALPADYDMEIISRRVAARGSATDDFPHLGLKAYAVRRDRWQVVRFTLWAEAPARPAPESTAFDVLHASTPELEGLPTGRLW